MAKHAAFHIDDIDGLRAELERLRLELPIADDLSALAEPLALPGGRQTPNRFAVHPMEGFDSTPDGAPGDLSFRRYRRYAEGGSGLIWFEATAVLPEARSNPGQLWIHHGSVGVFARLVERTRQAARRIHGHDVVLILQLTHSGRYSKPTGVPKPIIAHHSAVLDPKHGLPADYPLITDDALDRLQETFLEAARLAAQAGFDGVDVKACHRYLVSELLASHTRDGRYGGSFENRTRFLREVLARVRRELPDLLATTRMNAFDGIEHPYGWGVDAADPALPDLTEPIRLVRGLRDEGLPLLNVTIGNPYSNAHLGRPFNSSVVGVAPPEEHPLEGVARILGVVRAMQESVPDVPVISTGYAWLRHLMPQVAAGMLAVGGAALVGQGRGAFAYPDSPMDILREGRMDPGKCCVACSACTQIMRDGGRTGCVVRDAEVYKHEYRKARRFAMDRLREEARRCRDCHQPTCQTGCPARVDVPGFLRAFADGDVAGAYAILRRRNALPELCAYVCPSEVQCEGACVESVFSDAPIPIRDIQLVVCRIAREAGLTGARLPDGVEAGSVGVVGGGPAGVACAIALLELGHEAVLYERGSELGGVPDGLIPDERFGTSRSEVSSILAPALAAGRLRLELGVELGDSVTLADLRARHDAVFLGLGLGAGTTLGTGEGVLDALDFLRRAKSGELAAAPDRVAVLGGGNTAADAATTARALGARDVYLIYRRSFAEMPAWPAERDALIRSGVHILVLTQPVGCERDASGALVGVRVARTELGEADASGRRRPVVVEGGESVLPVGLVIEAKGQRPSEAVEAALEGLDRTRSGLLVTRAGSAETSAPGVYAGGDLVNGGATVVQAVAEGMAAAREIHQRLSAAARV